MCTAVRNKRFLNIDRNVHLLKKMTEVRDPHKSNIFSSKLICKKLKLASKPMYWACSVGTTKCTHSSFPISNRKEKS